MRVVACALATVLLTVSCAGAPVPTAGTASTSPTASARVPCGPSERFERHAHAHLTIVVRGQLRSVPANIGITTTSICWLHTHDTTGIIHIEAGDARPLTLGDFFSVWGKRLSVLELVDERAGSGDSVQATENQQAFTGALENIVLDDKDYIVLQLGPPFPRVPPYVWPEGY